MPLPRLLVLSLGGTITMTGGGPGGIQPRLGAADLVATVPALAGIAEIEARSPFRVGSSSLTIENIASVAGEIRAGLKEGFDGVIVIQGTDTIEETAFALDLIVDDERPVVVIGAMRGAEAPGADGPANLYAAALVATAPEARGLGTLVVLNDEIHAARFVRKAHTALASTFVSPFLGPLGLVAEGRARLLARVAATPKLAIAADTVLPPVALLKFAMGDDGRLVRALPGLGFKGAVLEGMGAGHVPGPVAELVGTLAGEMPVVLASRTLGGPVFTKTYGYPGSEIDLIGRGVIPAGVLQGPKARLLLTFALALGLDRAGIGQAFAPYQ